MRFINKNIKLIYAISVIVIIILSYIKTLYSDPQNEGIIMAIPFGMLVLGAVAGPAGSMILGVVATFIVYFIF